MRILLASKSPARLATLVSAGVTPIVRVSAVDEPAVLERLHASSPTPPTPPDEVLALAAAKRDAVVASLLALPSPIDEDGADSLLVVGCDSMLEIGGRMLGKPHTPEVARERIREMRGTSATLWTGHAVTLVGPGAAYAPGPTLARAASTIVRFGDITDAEIDAYVESGEPLHVAGSFTIDGLGGPFIAGVEGDHHSVVGISLPLLRSLAAELGVFWPDLWDHRRGMDRR